MKIKKFVLLYKLLDADDEELTRTGKVRRRFVYGLYLKIIEAMYNNQKDVEVTLLKLYQRHPGLQIASVTSTGYGEELVKNAFHCDRGLVRLLAHFTAAKHFMPNVDFIIDIGGQDMKCFKIEDGAISNIFLNEACSSGCESDFLQTFAQALGYDVKEFAALGLFADKPVDLGDRCGIHELQCQAGPEGRRFH